MTPAEPVKALHDLYVTATGHEIRINPLRERAWHEWQKYGHTRADLALVIAYLRKEIANTRRNPGALKFSNLVEQPDRFEEDLALARAANRIRSRPAIQQRSVTHGDTTRLVEHDPVDDETWTTAAKGIAELKKQLKQC